VKSQTADGLDDLRRVLGDMDVEPALILSFGARPTTATARRRFHRQICWRAPDRASDAGADASRPRRE
jgi:hypothetical protein